MHGPEDYMNYGNSEVIAMAGNKDVEGLIGVLIYNRNKYVVKRAIFALGEVNQVPVRNALGVKTSDRIVR